MAAMVLDVVVTVTVNGTAVAPVTVTGLGLNTQAAPVGSPEQDNVTVPVNPLSALTVRL